MTGNHGLVNDRLRSEFTWTIAHRDTKMTTMQLYQYHVILTDTLSLGTLLRGCRKAPIFVMRPQISVLKTHPNLHAL